MKLDSTLLALAFAGLLGLAQGAEAQSAATPAPPAPAAGAEADPRVGRADALLGEREAWPRAVDLYRAVLEEHPESAPVRHRLARVLSWGGSYTEAISGYDRMLAAPSPPPEARVERAEVLSWAGRLEEAEAEFRAILEAEPRNGRAARGLARTFRWSGRAGEADRAYERAIAIEDDAEARAEWAELRASNPPSGEGSSDYFSDSDDFDWFGSSVSSSFHPNLDTRITARTGYARISQPANADGAQPAPQLPGEDRAGEFELGLRRRLGPRWQAEFELGGRFWDHARSTLLAHARLQYTTGSQAVLALAVNHADLLERAQTLAAVEEGTRDTTVRISAWKGFTEQLEGYFQVATSFLSDSNFYHGMGANLDYRPWRDQELSLQVSLDYLSYSKRSALYYDPAADLGGAISVRQRIALPGNLSLELQAGGGYGYTRQAGVISDGPTYSVSGELSWARGPWRFSVGGGRLQSQRRSSYVSHRLTALLGLAF